MSESETLELLRLRQQNLILQAQSLERDVLVMNYARLINEAQQMGQTIAKMEEEVRRNETLQNSAGLEPVNPGPDFVNSE